MNIAAPKLLDVTLRDCATVNDWQFSEPQLSGTLEALDKQRLDYVELGYFVESGKVNGVERAGPAVCDQRYLEFAASKLKYPSAAVMLRMSEATPTAIRQIARHNVGLIRFPIHPSEVLEVIPYCEEAHAHGVQVSINLIFLSRRSEHEVLHTASASQRIGADFFCVADTLSGLLPCQVESIVRAVKRTTDLKIGFHAHDGLRAALVNTLVAVESGAEIIDSSLGGMGSGGRNLMTELIALYVASRWQRRICVSKLVSASTVFLSDWVAPALESEVASAACGLLNLNTKEVATAEREAKEKCCSLLEHLESRFVSGEFRFHATV